VTAADRGAAPEVVVVGSVHMDLIARAQRLPGHGESVLGTEFRMYPGGKAGNQAVAAAQQGARTTIVARVGDDALGRELRDALRQNNVDVSHLEMASEQQTGVSPVLMDANGDYASIIVPGASGGMSPAAVAGAHNVMRRCAVLMLQLEVAREVNEASARIAERAIVLLNASPTPATIEGAGWNIWRDVDIALVNFAEALALLGAPKTSLRDAIDVAQSLRRLLSLPAVVMTLGPNGAAIADESSGVMVPGFDAVAIDTIGAGDAFAGAVAAALARGTALDEAVVIGNAAGALAVGRHGAFDAAPALPATTRLVASRLGQPGAG
jgi:ribokinase